VRCKRKMESSNVREGERGGGRERVRVREKGREMGRGWGKTELQTEHAHVL